MTVIVAQPFLGDAIAGTFRPFRRFVAGGFIGARLRLAIEHTGASYRTGLLA
jgi:hypothetical protein